MRCDRHVISAASESAFCAEPTTHRAVSQNARRAGLAEVATKRWLEQGSAVRARSAPRSNLVERMSSGAPEKAIVTSAAVAARATNSLGEQGADDSPRWMPVGPVRAGGLCELGKNESPGRVT